MEDQTKQQEAPRVYRIINIETGIPKYVGKQIFQDKVLLEQMGFMQQDTIEKEDIKLVIKPTTGTSESSVTLITPEPETTTAATSVTSVVKDPFNPLQVGMSIPEAPTQAEVEKANKAIEPARRGRKPKNA